MSQVFDSGVIHFRNATEEMVAARSWQMAMIRAWQGPNPLYDPPRARELRIRYIALEAGLEDGQRLPFERLELIRMATRNGVLGAKLKADRRAFISLALWDYLDDLEGGETAMLPYQLAFSYCGHMLGDNGLPGGRARFRWPWPTTRVSWMLSDGQNST